MTQPRGKTQRHARPGSEYGLVTRVAKKLGKSLSLVSAVKNGYAVSAKVTEALSVEREIMRREAQTRKGN